MRMGDDVALGRLAEDRLEVDRWDHLTRQQVTQDLAWSHAWQLIGIADQDQLSVGTDRGHDGSGELRVEHAGLVQDDHVERQGQIRAGTESGRPSTQQTMARACLASAALAEPLGSLAGGSSQRY